MKSLTKWALLWAGMVLLVFAVSAASGAPPAGKVKHTNGWIQSVAMSGSQVAYSTGTGVFYGSGAKVYVWNVRTGAGRLISGHNPDPVYEVALSATRVAWIARGATAGPTAELNESLFAASLRKSSRPHLLGTAYRTETEAAPGLPPGCAGDWIGGLVGSANSMAVNRWQTTGVGQVAHAELDLIGATGLRKRTSDPGSIVAQSANDGRIAVLRSTDAWPGADDLCGTTAIATLGVYAPTGRLLAAVTVVGAKEAALSGNELVTLTKASRLAVYNWRSGRLLHSWRVPQVSWVHLEDVYGKVAVYSVNSGVPSLHLLQLTTGKDLLLRRNEGIGQRNYMMGNEDSAQLEAPGLVYAAGKQLVFVPMARVLAAVSKGHVT